MGKKLYAASIMANKDARILSNPAYAVAESEDEALGSALRLCRDKWPLTDGWYGHQASVFAIPDEVVRAVQSKRRPARPGRGR